MQKVFDPLVEHTGGVESVCFSPDGKRIASGSYDCTVIVWNAETGTILTTHDVHRGWVLGVAFSPDGLKLASASSDHTILVWRIDNAELLLNINAHRGWVQSIAWSPDGQQLVSVSDDKTIKFWDASYGAPIGQPCTGHTGWIFSLVISCDGSFIATASRVMTVRLWSTKTHWQIGQVVQCTDQVYCVALSSIGTLLASGSGDGTTRLLSIQDTLERYGVLETQNEKLEQGQVNAVNTAFLASNFKHLIHH